MRLQI